jgi:hypothetical protein
VAASYLLQPGGLSSVVFQLPEATQLVAIDIDGLPAQYRILADGNCEVFLYSTSQPQQIGICLIDEPVRGDDGAAPVSREIALPIEIPVAETLWLASGPAALASESLSSLRLNAREADTRQLEALKTKLHNFESSSPLAQQALANELRTSVALAQGWAASAQGEGAFNDAASGTLFELARLRANAELILGDAWRQPIETERVESSASSATGITSSFSPGGGFLFPGLQAELTVPSGESPGSTWPRWIMAIVLLTTGILQLVYTSRRTQPADKNPGT